MQRAVPQVGLVGAAPAHHDLGETPPWCTRASTSEPAIRRPLRSALCTAPRDVLCADDLHGTCRRRPFTPLPCIAPPHHLTRTAGPGKVAPANACRGSTPRATSLASAGGMEAGTLPAQTAGPWLLAHPDTPMRRPVSPCPQVAQQLDLTMAQLEERVAELALLLPGLDAKLDRMQVGRNVGRSRSGKWQNRRGAGRDATGPVEVCFLSFDCLHVRFCSFRLWPAHRRHRGAHPALPPGAKGVLRAARDFPCSAGSGRCGDLAFAVVATQLRGSLPVARRPPRRRCARPLPRPRWCWRL